MSDILETIVAHKHVEVQELLKRTTLAQLQRQVSPMLSTLVPSMSRVLAGSPSGIIAEFKRKSPSKGWIHADANPATVTAAYQRGGASALSILTDEHFFGGDDSFVRQARQAGVTLPVLYKNFIVHRAQLYQARLCGASAVLLIAACLTLDQCRDLLAEAHDVGMEALLEMHSEAELRYAELEPDMCGVNNRNLGTFVTDVGNSFALAAKLPPQAVKVSESGISSPATVRELRQAGYRGFLIGEHFMREPDPGAALAQFIGSAV